ncbi:MAG: adenylate/guanylate cyclase domain-containing protein [Oligoflexia bacterium]|nr:adenylate/guanylate cyclase domain-containing protein [Oligoflexia bacterium]
MTNELNHEIKEEERRIFNQRISVATYIMAVPLVLLYVAVDMFYAPDRVMEFFKIRLFVIPMAIIVFILYRFEKIKNDWFTLPAHFVTLFLGTYNGYLAYVSGAETSPYYAGLNLITIGSLSFLPWKLRGLIISTITIYAPYIFMIFLKSEKLNYSQFVPSISFMTSTVFLGFITNILTRKLRESEIRVRLDLKNENLKKEHVIKKKTEEGIYLEKLANQFSPQVISAIKNSQLSLSDRIRKEITSIFIDIQDSTGRSTKIDYAAYTKTISDFFSDCISILLKNNVTIGTYLGDGLLAFTNAPQSTDSHAQAAIKACLEILESSSRKKYYYNDNWRADFNVRIGINTGFAYIGFFPNEQRGTYTAMGESINLTSRLCSLAKPNSICVTKNFIKQVANDKEFISKIVATGMGRFENIKGFEGEFFDLYSVEPSHKDHVLNQTNSCPLCQGLLVLKEDLGNSAIYKCSNCSYFDLFEKDVVKKAA